MTPIRFTPVAAFVAASIVLVGHVVFHYADLPQTVAAHFDWRGRANGFASRQAFLLMNIGVVALFALLFWGVGHMRKLSPRFVNLPHKDYWLSPERREASMAFVVDWTRWFFALVTLLNVLLMGSVLHANLKIPVEIGDWPLYETGAFLVVLAGMIVWLLRRFPRPPAQ